MSKLDELEQIVLDLPKENKELRGPKFPPQRRRSKTRRDKSRARRAKR